MPLYQGEAGIMPDGAENGYIGVVFNHSAQFGFVPRATELVEDDASNPDARVERLITQDQWCDTAGHASCIEDQHNGKL